MKKVLVVLVALLGVAFLGLAIYYWMTPAGSLPHFFPGYTAGATAKHFKHGIAAFVLAIGCGVLVRFMSAKHENATSPAESPKE